MTDDATDKNPRHRRVQLELPETTDLASVGEAEQAVIRAAAQGLISSRVALDFTHMLDHRRKAIADVDLQKQMDELLELDRRRRAERALR
jgi:hypothetical protein